MWKRISNNSFAERTKHPTLRKKDLSNLFILFSVEKKIPCTINFLSSPFFTSTTPDLDTQKSKHNTKVLS